MNEEKTPKVVLVADHKADELRLTIDQVLTERNQLKTTEMKEKKEVSYRRGEFEITGSSNDEFIHQVIKRDQTLRAVTVIVIVTAIVLVAGMILT